MTKTKLSSLTLGMIVGLGMVVAPAVMAQLDPHFEACHAAAMAIERVYGHEEASKFFNFCMGL